MDNSPTALFDSYEQDFKQIIGSIRDKLDGGEGRNERGGKAVISCGFACVNFDLFHYRTTKGDAEESGDGIGRGG